MIPEELEKQVQRARKEVRGGERKREHVCTLLSGVLSFEHVTECKWVTESCSKAVHYTNVFLGASWYKIWSK